MVDDFERLLVADLHRKNTMATSPSISQEEYLEAAERVLSMSED